MRCRRMRRSMKLFTFFVRRQWTSFARVYRHADLSRAYLLSCLRRAGVGGLRRISHRYGPPDSEVTTPLKRSDWKVERGSVLHAFAAVFDVTHKDQGVSEYRMQGNKRELLELERKLCCFKLRSTLIMKGGLGLRLGLGLRGLLAWFVTGILTDSLNQMGFFVKGEL